MREQSSMITYQSHSILVSHHAWFTIYQRTHKNIYLDWWNNRLSLVDWLMSFLNLHNRTFTLHVFRISGAWLKCNRYVANKFSVDGSAVTYHGLNLYLEIVSICISIIVYKYVSGPLFIRPFEKRDVLCRGNVRPSVRPSAFSGLFFNMLWDINLKLAIYIQ